jgi:hypothetical protein
MILGLLFSELISIVETKHPTIAERRTILIRIMVRRGL